MTRIAVKINPSKITIAVTTAKIKLAPIGTVNPVTLAGYVKVEDTYGEPVTVQDPSAFVNSGGMWGSQITTDRGDPVTLGA